jgi:TetR/AcrR family transcriptional repressor of multidrug resistance operon
VKPKDDQKLEAIAQATYLCVHERGMRALTLAEIAKRAGLATSTLYVYFPNKQALLDALYERAKTAAVAQLMGANEDGQPVKARLRRIWLALLELRLRQPEQQVFMEQYASSEYMSEHNRTLGTHLSAVFVALVRQGQAEELLKPIAVPFHQICLLGSVQETAKLIAQQGLPDDDATRNTAFILCWDAMKA